MTTIHSCPVLIIGGGPAGYAASIYAARANLKPILVTGPMPGGQLMVTTDVENYPGFADVIQGPWLMEQMELQARHVGTNIIQDIIEEVHFQERPFCLRGSSGNMYTADSIIIATGAQAKWLGLPSEEEFRGFGVSGCATCDGFFFRGKKVAVIGGGNTAVEEALYMTNHAEEVFLIHRRDTLRAEGILQDRLFKNPKIKILWNKALLEVKGEEEPLKKVTELVLEDTQIHEKSTLPINGVFIAIGHKPMTEIFEDHIKMDEEGYIQVQPGQTRTSVEGVFAAGDVTDKIYRQAVTAAGLGCMAALDVNRYLQEKGHSK